MVFAVAYTTRLVGVREGRMGIEIDLVVGMKVGTRGLYSFGRGSEKLLEPGIVRVEGLVRV